jgi:hypothetical protein
MFERNSFLHGFLVGLLLPLAVAGGLFLFFKGLDQLNIMSTIGFRPMFRERTITLIGIVANAYFIQGFNKRRFTESIRGVSVATIIYVVIWLVVFGKTVL